MIPSVIMDPTKYMLEIDMRIVDTKLGTWYFSKGRFTLIDRDSCGTRGQINDKSQEGFCVPEDHIHN